MGADDARRAIREAAWRGDGLSLVEKLRSASFTHFGLHDKKACKADPHFVAAGDHVMPSPELLAEAAEALSACHGALQSAQDHDRTVRPDEAQHFGENASPPFAATAPENGVAE